jgi:hypothetical protein
MEFKALIQIHSYPYAPQCFGLHDGIPLSPALSHKGRGSKPTWPSVLRGSKPTLITVSITGLLEVHSGFELIFILNV